MISSLGLGAKSCRPSKRLLWVSCIFSVTWILQHFLSPWSRVAPLTVAWIAPRGASPVLGCLSTGFRTRPNSVINGFAPSDALISHPQSGQAFVVIISGEWTTTFLLGLFFWNTSNISEILLVTFKNQTRLSNMRFIVWGGLDYLRAFKCSIIYTTCFAFQCQKDRPNY